MDSAVSFPVGVLAVPALVVSWLVAAEAVVRRVQSRRMQTRLRAGAWLAPAAVVLGVVLLYPLAYSAVKSFFGPDGSSFVGLANYSWMFTDPAILAVLRNNAIWVILYTLLTTAAGLVVAICADRVRYESLAKAIIIVPTAISLTATAVIWQLMYKFQPAGAKQTGTVSALVELIPGLSSQAWLQDPHLSTYAIIIAAVWAHAGIATVILSAAVKSIPNELVEAAKVDGAGGARVLQHVVLPQLWPTIVVVGTIEVIYALKVFDAVYVMTGGLYNSDVIATQVYTQLFLSNNLGRASAMALFLVVLVLPVVAFNIRRVKE